MKEVIMKALRYSVPGLVAAATTLLLSSGAAHAHFKLLSPESWLKEDGTGGPQKGGPCGPGGADDVQPVPMSMKVTEVHAGDTIMVAFDETIHHPGWFRIALAEDPKDFEEPTFPNTSDCTVDMSTVPTQPHGNVLVDGLGMDENVAGSNRKFMEMVTLPDKPCEKCTLQVIQVMADAIHAPPGCVYHHCAELKILPKSGAAAAGSGGSASGAAGTTAANAGSSASAGSGAAAGSGGSTAAAAGGSGGSSAAAAGSKAVAHTAGSSAPSSSGTSSASGSAGKVAAPSSSGGTTGSMSTAKAGSAAPSTGSTSSPSTSSDSASGASSESGGGCAVSGAGADANGAAFALLSVAGLFFANRRKRK